MRARRTIFGHPVQSPEELFAALDCAKSGFISIGELVSAFNRLGVGLSQAQVERLAAFVGTSPRGKLEYGKIVALLGDAKTDPAATEKSSHAAATAAPAKASPLASALVRNSGEGQQVAKMGTVLELGLSVDDLV